MEEYPKLKVYNTHTEITQYELGENPKLEQKLSKYDKIYYRFIPIGYLYDDKKKSLLIPSGVSINMVSSMTDRPIEKEYDTDPYDKISVRLRTLPRSELQKESIAFMLGEGQYSNYKNYSQLVLNLDTGEGKTYIAIASICIKQLKTIIIIDNNTVRDQWVQSLLKYTDIDERSILHFTGSSTCESIINKPNKYKQYKVFITTHSTLKSYGDRYGWNKVHELFNNLKVGLKIYDEAHLNFSNIIRVDCYSNTKFTYYLTATLGRSDTSENFIYNTCFRSIPKYIQKERTEYKGKSYIIYLVYTYKSNPTIDDIANLKNKYGFNMMKYSEYQLLNDTKFFSNILTLTKALAVEKNLKTLILTSTINGVEDIADYLTNELTDKVIAKYHSKIDDESKRIAKEADIIVSTMKSMGTGVDIPGLRAIINTESYKSKIITEQALGRLRKPEDGSTCIYCEIVDKAFTTIRTQQRAREKVLRDIVGKILYIKN